MSRNWGRAGQSGSYSPGAWIERAGVEDARQQRRAGTESLNEFVAVCHMPSGRPHWVHVVILRAPARHLYCRTHRELCLSLPGDIESEFEPVLAGVEQRDRDVDKQQVHACRKQARRSGPLRIPMPCGAPGSQVMRLEACASPSQVVLGS